MLLRVVALLSLLLLTHHCVYANTEKITFTHRSNGNALPPPSLPSTRTLIPPYTIYRNERILPLVPGADPSQHRGSESAPRLQWYRLESLIDGESYEARVSYAATVRPLWYMRAHPISDAYVSYPLYPSQSPTDFKLSLLSYSDLIKAIETPELVPREQSTIDDQFLLVQGVSTGVSRVKGKLHDSVVYNIGECPSVRPLLYTFNLLRCSRLFRHCCRGPLLTDDDVCYGESPVLEKVYLGGIPYQAGKLAIAIIASLALGIFVVVPWVEKVIQWTLSQEVVEKAGERKGL
ncbi:hypothetical protein BC938DRAFT_481636 [Jimgerdemannia flammicorona]|uniref:Uncharacterized protein n=1 Tax=Jimgerdemannia flammicorona TaxID=994334 RepID=A0A433QFP4_9FUNG|nr:hypothetical protein BC938DRAFT_481636 [Jimgerdemannia flammicorona]